MSNKTTTEKPASPFAGFESAIIAELGEQAHKLIFADWLQDNAEPDNDYTDLEWYVRWMGEEGVKNWPIWVDSVYIFWSASKECTEDRKCHDFYWWHEDWRPCCRVLWPVSLFLGEPGYLEYRTLLDALRSYYSAYQARQLMKDGKRVARVPREVAVCPVCGMELIATTYSHKDDGLPIVINCPTNYFDGEGLCGCTWQDDVDEEVTMRIKKWCHAVG